MAQKPHVLESQQREARQKLYMAAPPLAKVFPTAKEMVFELRFVDPEGKASPSPHKRIFTSDMQAFFEFACPLRDCTGGGFSLTDKFTSGRPKRQNIETSGTLTCNGKRKRNGAAGACCGVELHYRMKVRKKASIAA